MRRLSGLLPFFVLLSLLLFSFSGVVAPQTVLADHTSDPAEVVLVGSFQSELGCPGDWQPDCLRSWLQDSDGDGVYTFNTTLLPAGEYEAKVAINESWNENYGASGVPGGDNIHFTVAEGDTVT